MSLELYDLDASMTHAINGLAEAGGIADFLMTWMSAIGVPLLVLAVLLGVFPQYFLLSWMQPSVNGLVESLSKLTGGQ